MLFRSKSFIALSSTLSSIDLKDISYPNKLDKDFYDSKKEIIEENYQLALKYVNYEKNIADKIIKIFKHNNLA